MTRLGLLKVTDSLDQAELSNQCEFNFLISFKASRKSGVHLGRITACCRGNWILKFSFLSVHDVGSDCWLSWTDLENVFARHF